MSDDTINWKQVIGVSSMVLGLLFVFIFSYFGSIYIFKGNQVYCIAIAAIAIIIFAVLTGALSAQKARDRNKGFTITEGVLLFVYAICAIFAFGLMAHFVNLELTLKDDVKRLGREKVKEMSNLVKNYEETVDKTINSIDLDVTELISEYRTTKNFPKFKLELSSKFGISVSKDGSEVRHAKKALESKLKAQKIRALEQNRRYSDIKRETKALEEEASVNLEVWNRPYLYDTFVELDGQINKNAEWLPKAFKAPGSVNSYWNAYSFEPQAPSPKANVLISNPLELQRRYSPSLLLPIIVALVLHILILLPYFITQRQGMQVFYLKGRRRKPSGGIEV